MAAEQRKTSFSCMIERRGPPTVGAMAGFAIGAVLSFVLVVSLMAGDAGRPKLSRFRRLDVTALASDGFMITGQRKVCVDGMVEADTSPCFGDVTASAVCPKSAVMNVVYHMAATAGFGCILIALIQMAGAANQSTMTAFQTEPGLFAMIEVCQRLMPTALGVAACTFVAEDSVMGIILLVAVDTV